MTPERCEEVAAQLDQLAADSDLLAQEYRESAAIWRRRAEALR